MIFDVIYTAPYVFLFLTAFACFCFYFIFGYSGNVHKFFLIYFIVNGIFFLIPTPNVVQRDIVSRFESSQSINNNFESPQFLFKRSVACDDGVILNFEFFSIAKSLNEDIFDYVASNGSFNVPGEIENQSNMKTKRLCDF